MNRNSDKEGGEQMKILNKLSFHKKIFLACLLTALVPLLCSSVVMIRLFTASLDRQNLEEGRTQITKAEARLEAVFEKCEEACETIVTDKKTARIMIEKSEADHQREMYLSLYQATQETSGYARFSIYDAGGICAIPRIQRERQKTCQYSGGF